MGQGVYRTERIRGRQLQYIRERHLRHHPLCVHCAKRGVVTEAVHVDHITALANDGEESEANRQSLCYECHAIKTANDLGYKVKMGGDIRGDPVDPNHHWNKPLKTKADVPAQSTTNSPGLTPATPAKPVTGKPPSNPGAPAGPGTGTPATSTPSRPPQ